MKILLPFLICLLLLACNQQQDSVAEVQTPENEAAEEPILRDSLSQMKENFEKTAPEEKRKAYNEGVEQIRQSGLLEKAIKKGDKAPDFILKNALGEEVSLYEELKKGPVILTWYRGGWCPYCNVHLHYLQDNLKEIEKAGGQLIALTPEKPDKSLSTAEKHALEFQVLSDLNNKVARKYGLVFKLNEEVARLYKQSFDLAEYNDSESNELPVTASYVIDSNGIVTYSYLNPDYRERAEPAVLVTELKKLQ